MIQIFPIKISADIKQGDALDAIIIEGIRKSGAEVIDGDILAVTHKIVSKAEGRVVDLRMVKPSADAARIAKEQRKDPRLTQVILNESEEIVAAKNGIIISETRHGFVCANAGVDQSNAQGKNDAVLLPHDPDKSAQRLKKAVEEKTGKTIAVIVTDTFGRPFRHGQTNIAIGVAGIDPIKSYIGNADMYGRILRVTEIAVIDEIASAAELVMGKAQGIPVALVRGYDFQRAEQSTIKSLLRPKEKDLFRQFG